MKLIIQKIGDDLFAYRETNKHHKVVEPQRLTPRLDPALLDNECELAHFDDFHMVFNIKK